MSAEVLREAAEKMRDLAERQIEGSSLPDLARRRLAPQLAVADFLDDIAGMWPNGHSICKHHAVIIARTYLGSLA